MNIPFNTPYHTGKEIGYIQDAVALKHLSGNGKYTKRCQSFLEKKYGFQASLLTTSCTDALEMIALLLQISPGDEVIIPSYTFVSTANAFALRGAKIVFADSRSDHPGLDEDLLEELITPKTKAIVAVHYAGVACDMDKLKELGKRHGVAIIEDAAQAIDSFYRGKPLGSLGDFGAFSFHETKNIIAGEGGMLLINSPELKGQAEIIWEKGTNRSAFFRGEVDKYGWVDLGSSFLPSDMVAAFLYAQLESLEYIQEQRSLVWNRYWEGLKDLKDRIGLPVIPEYATNNYHMFYLVANTLKERSALIEHLKKDDVHAVFHYQSLHKSSYFGNKHDGRNLIQSDRYTESLVRLPFFVDLTESQQNQVIDSIRRFYH